MLSLPRAAALGLLMSPFQGQAATSLWCPLKMAGLTETAGFDLGNRPSEFEVRNGSQNQGFPVPPCLVRWEAWEKEGLIQVVVVGPVGKWGRFGIHFSTGLFSFCFFFFGNLGTWYVRVKRFSGRSTLRSEGGGNGLAFVSGALPVSSSPRRCRPFPPTCST